MANAIEINVTTAFVALNKRCQELAVGQKFNKNDNSVLNNHYNTSNLIFSIKKTHGIAGSYEDQKLKIRNINGTVLVISDIPTFFQEVGDIEANVLLIENALQSDSNKNPKETLSESLYMPN